MKPALAAEPTPLLRLLGISKNYGKGDARVAALTNLDLEIPEGSFTAIMGRSGSGKSTLLHLLGLLDRPSAGALKLGDEIVDPTTNLSTLARLRREWVGFVFQQFFLLPRMSAFENVLLPSIYTQQSKREARERAQKLLADVGLEHRLHHRPNELSGGEKQRVAIARALMNKPKIILADEPTGNLDSTSEQLILDILKDLHQAGITILVVTHDEHVAKAAERRIQLEDGMVVS